MPSPLFPPDSVDLHLLTILKQMVADLHDPTSHYMVSASYFDFVDSDRVHKRRYMNPIYVHQDSASNIDFDEEGILLDTFFSPGKDVLPERIRIPYTQTYQVAKNSTGGMFVDEDSIYRDMSKFKMPPIK